jgi:hypothetical protein
VKLTDNNIPLRKRHVAYAGNHCAAQLNAVLIFGQARNCDLSHGELPASTDPATEGT